MLNLLNRNLDFDEKAMYDRIIQMYAENDASLMKDHCTSTQAQAFEKEIDTLKQFGLKKELVIDLKNDGHGSSSAVNTTRDGKVDAHFIVSAGKIKEIYRNQNNRKKHQRKYKNAFLESHIIKSNQVFSYDKEGYVMCKNCGAPMEQKGEHFHCDYCNTTFLAEAIDYLVSRFQISNALRGFSKILYFLIPMIALAIYTQVSGISKERAEEIMNAFTLAAGIVISVIFLAAVVISLYRLIKDYGIKRKIRGRDPHFSVTLLRQRITDLLQLQPEILEHKSGERVLVRAVEGYLGFEDYSLSSEEEQVTITCKVDALRIKPSGKSARLRDGLKSYKLKIRRKPSTLTKVHYEPDQYTCNNCGSHEVIRGSDTQTCSHCQTPQPMDMIDWVLAE